MDNPPLILASSSAYRKQLLARLGKPFFCVSPNIDETAKINENPEALALRLAREKAQAVSIDYPDHLIIASDQVACCEGQILGKPNNFEIAKAQLQRQSGKTVLFHTAVAVTNNPGSAISSENITTTVKFRSLDQATIINYLEQEQPFDCAGSFKSEGLGICLFEKITSDDPTALIGLPLIKTAALLERLGHKLL